MPIEKKSPEESQDAFDPCDCALAPKAEDRDVFVSLPLSSGICSRPQPRSSESWARKATPATFPRSSFASKRGRRSPRQPGRPRKAKSSGRTAGCRCGNATPAPSTGVPLPDNKQLPVAINEDISTGSLNLSVGNSSFLPKIDTETNIKAVYERSRRMSVSDVSIDDVSASLEEKKEDVTPFALPPPAAVPTGDARPAEEIVDTPASASEPHHSNELVFIPSPFEDAPQKRMVEETKSPTLGKKPFRFVFGSTAIPRAGSTGEDAHFCNPRSLGVADGVSGWCQYGIDPSAFSQQIMQGCGERCEAAGREGEIDPLDALTYAFSRVEAIGSSTASLVAINGHTLSGLNLGDSGFLCFTKIGGEYVNRGVSKEQLHTFNTPFQLSKLPSEEEIAELRNHVDPADVAKLIQTIERKELCQDTPDSADKYTLKLQDDDILVLGTDGNDSTPSQPE